MFSLMDGLRGAVTLYLLFFTLLPKLFHLLTPTSPVKNRLLCFTTISKVTSVPTVVHVYADGTGESAKKFLNPVIDLLDTLYPHVAFHPVDGMNGPNSVADGEERKAGQASRADTFMELILK